MKRLQSRAENKPWNQGTKWSKTFMDQRGEKSRDQRTRREIRENPSLRRKELVEDPHPLQLRESQSKENQRIRVLCSLSALLFMTAAYTMNYFCPGTSLHSLRHQPYPKPCTKFSHQQLYAKPLVSGTREEGGHSQVSL